MFKINYNEQLYNNYLGPIAQQTSNCGFNNV